MSENKNSDFDFRNADTPEKVKFFLNAGFSFSNAYHYTTLETLHKIFSNKTLRMSQMSKMNDLKESTIAEGCNDYFFCMTKESTSVENFGMWAMYGKIKEFDKNNLDSKAKAKTLGVKIQFSKKVIDNLRNDLGLSFYKVGYVDLFSDTSIVYNGEKNTKVHINIKNKILAGYIKDNAWKYEKEFRLRKSVIENNDNNFIDIPISDEILKQLIVYPNPLSSVEECRKIFNDLNSDIEKSKIIPYFEKNKYENTYI